MIYQKIKKKKKILKNNKKINMLASNKKVKKI